MVLTLVAVSVIPFSTLGPVRQAFLNGLIPSAQRATVLSSDNLLASAGGVVVQPALGKVVDEQACRTAGRDLTTTEWRDNFGDRPYRKVCP